MNIDLNAILAFVQTIDPKVAAVVGVVIFVVQHLGAKQGANLTLAGLITLINRLLGKTPSDPVLAPKTPDSKPDAPVDVPKPSPSAEPDPLDGQPVRKFLRDLALKLFAEKVSKVLASAKDDAEAAVKVMSAFNPKSDAPASPDKTDSPVK